MKLPLAVTLAWALLVSTNCSRTADLLHYQKNDGALVHTVEHKLKELQGEKKVDILWVIDNSGSMGDHQDNLITNMDFFINEFVKNNLEWKMGLISTSEYENPFIGFTPSSLLTFQTPNGVDLFRKAIARLGINGATTEMAFTPIVNTLKGYSTFARSDAKLAVIIVTDAREQSYKDEVQDVLDQLVATKGSLKRVTAYGVFGAEDKGCPDNSSEGHWKYVGSTYESFITTLHGKTYSLCAADFWKNLVDMGKDLVKQIQYARIYLAERPVPSSIKVICKGEEIQGGQESEGGHWIYDFELNAIIFSDTNFAAGDDESVRVEFTPVL